MVTYSFHFFFSRAHWACLETNRCLKELVLISRGLLCRLLLSKVDFEYEYSQLPAINGHSRKRTALLPDAFSNPRFTSQSHSVFAHFHNRTLSRKRTRTLLKMKIGFFFCLRSLLTDGLCIIIDSWQWNLSLICNKSTKLHWHNNRTVVRIGFVKSPFVRGKFALFCYPIKHNENPLVHSPVSGHPLYFSLVSAYRNNSRKRTALIKDTFFNSRGYPLTKELTVYIYFSISTRLRWFQTNEHLAVTPQNARDRISEDVLFKTSQGACPP